MPRGLPQRLVVDQRRLHLDVAAAARSRAGGDPRAGCRASSPWGARRASPASARRSGTGRAARPSRRWSRARACSSRSRCASRSFWRVERRPVDPRELGVRAVAAPVRAGERGELDRLDRRARLQVRPAAQIGEGALGVQRDPAFGGADELDLVRLLLRLEPRDRGVGRDLLARPGSVPPRAGGRSPSRSRSRSSSLIGSGTRSRSRSRRRSAGRSRSSRPGAGASRPRRAGARSSAGAPRARRGRACRAS